VNQSLVVCGRTQGQEKTANKAPGAHRRCIQFFYWQSSALIWMEGVWKIPCNRIRPPPTRTEAYKG
jgi:hypothetical protein